MITIAYQLVFARIIAILGGFRVYIDLSLPSDRIKFFIQYNPTAIDYIRTIEYSKEKIHRTFTPRVLLNQLNSYLYTLILH